MPRAGWRAESCSAQHRALAQVQVWVQALVQVQAQVQVWVLVLVLALVQVLVQVQVWVLVQVQALVQVSVLCSTSRALSLRAPHVARAHSFSILARASSLARSLALLSRARHHALMGIAPVGAAQSADLSRSAEEWSVDQTHVIARARGRGCDLRDAEWLGVVGRI